MTVSELRPALSHLSRVDKLRAMQHLATELVNEDEAHFAGGTQHPVGTPRTALDAAYQQMAQDESHETEALTWAEATVGDVADEAR